MPENREPADAEALRRQVEEWAYAVWESEGRPHGRDLDHWLQAEAEIMAPKETRSSVKPPSPNASPAGRKTKAKNSSEGTAETQRPLHLPVI
jgi:hypothetical protein